MRCTGLEPCCLRYTFSYPGTARRISLGETEGGKSVAMPQEIDNLLPLGDIPAGGYVLDLGCGSGWISYSRFPHLRFVGADQYAHADPASWPSNSWLILADAFHLPFGAATFDAAVCNYVFEHFSDPRSALRELERVIRPGGLLYLSIPRSSGVEDRLYRFTTKGGGHLQRYSFDSFMQMVYQESRFKLEGMGPAPGAFTWMQGIPFGDRIRTLLYQSFRLWHQATGRNPLVANNYLLLFRLGERPGFKFIRQVCSQCGNSFAESTAENASTWRCPVCAFDNVLVGP